MPGEQASSHLSFMILIIRSKSSRCAMTRWLKIYGHAHKNMPNTNLTSTYKTKLFRLGVNFASIRLATGSGGRK